MRMPSIDEPPCKSLAKSVSIYMYRVTLSNSVRRQFGKRNSEIRKQRPWTFGLKLQHTTEIRRMGPGLTANNHPFAKVCDARVKIIF